MKMKQDKQKLPTRRTISFVPYPAKWQ